MKCVVITLRNKYLSLRSWEKNTNVLVCATEFDIGTMSNWKPGKFQTICGRTFDSSTALADFLGVTVGAISHATSEAKAKGRMFFECGKPLKRFIRIIEPNVSDDSNLHETLSEQSTVLQDEQASQNVSSLHNLEFTVLPKTMKAMQVHAHIQAVALKLFPDRKLILADRSSDDGMSVSILKRVTGTFFERLTRFDIAETWMLHSQASTMGSHEQMVGESLLWFVRALQGDSYYGLTTELCKRKYPSLVISKYSIANDTSKYMQVIGNKRPYMGAEDILKFLLSDFARQGPHKYVFEDEMNTMRSPSPHSPPSFLRHTETTVRKEDKTPMLEETTEETTGDTSPVRNKHQTLPPTYDQSLTREYSYAQTQQCRETPALPPEPSNSVSNPSNSVSNPVSAQDDFMKTCCDIMKDVECSMQERRLMLGRGDYDEENTKKRKRALAADSIRNVTTILFAANKLLYSDSLYSDSQSSK